MDDIVTCTTFREIKIVWTLEHTCRHILNSLLVLIKLFHGKEDMIINR